MRLLITCLVLTLLAPAVASAGCEKDTDCKGDRICVRGECAEPGQVVAPAGQPAKLVRLPGDRYRYRGADIDWAEAQAILSTYSRSDETLRKGRGYTGLGVAFLAVGGAMLATSVGFAAAWGSAEAEDDRRAAQGLGESEGGNICAPIGEIDCANRTWGLLGAGGGMLAVGIPFTALGATAKHRAIERYNRAVEAGKLD